MQSDPGTEWERLTRLYAGKSEEELRELAEEFGNLTDVAQQVLRDEMRKRGLTGPAARAGAVPENRPKVGGWNRADEGESRIPGGEHEDSEDGDSDEPHEYTWKTLLCECDGHEQAWQIGEMLRRAGIESWIEGSQSSDSLDVRKPRVIVAADQVEDAQAIAARPVPQEIIDQSREKAEDFAPPTCPKCGAADPLLESVDPANAWRCENCGARWSESAAVENTGQNPAKKPRL